MGGVVEIVLLALVAVFVGLRLFSVLGQRTGHEQEPLPRPAKPVARQAPVAGPVPDAVPDRAEASDSIVSPRADAAIRKITSADSSFDINEFIVGAQAAYRMILEAFWKGDEEDLAYLVGDEVRASFAEAITARESEGHVVDNRLVRIDRTMIDSASLDGREARITVRFDADIAAVTRDKDGNVVAGSMSDAVPTHDEWTFARNLRDDDPNWKLVETDEAS